MEEPKCYKCGSTNSRCWDERNEWYECECEEWVPQDERYMSNGKEVHLVSIPVGYLACNDCGASWRDIHEDDGCKHLGNDREAGLEDDERYWGG